MNLYCAFQNHIRYLFIKHVLLRASVSPW
jgi:hypothetical protein